MNVLFAALKGGYLPKGDRLTLAYVVGIPPCTNTRELTASVDAKYLSKSLHAEVYVADYLQRMKWHGQAVRSNM